MEEENDGCVGEHVVLEQNIECGIKGIPKWGYFD